MSSPWLSVPLAEYEGHMRSPDVRQLGALGELFAEALACRGPSSVAVLGVAGGNGLERIDATVVRRVVGIDVNPTYLEAVRLRHERMAGLELHCVDLAKQRVNLPQVELVHAALVFEHAGLDLCLENALSLVAAGGALSVVLQLPSKIEQPVAFTPFPSIQYLKSHFALIDPAQVQEMLAQRKFHLNRQTRRCLPGGKALWMGVFAV